MSSGGKELGFGRRLYGLLARTPSLVVVKVLKHKVAIEGDRMGLVVLGVKCAFLSGRLRRRVYIELPEQDPSPRTSRKWAASSRRCAARKVPRKSGLRGFAKRWRSCG